MKEKPIMVPIPHYFLNRYIGDVTDWYVEDYGHSAQIEISIPPKYFDEEILGASQRQEQTLLKLGLLALTAKNEAQLVRYDESGFASWSESEMRNVVDQMTAYICIDCPEKLKDLANQVVLIEMQLEEWRETIKPQILAQFKELGIEA